MNKMEILSSSLKFSFVEEVSASTDAFDSCGQVRGLTAPFILQNKMGNKESKIVKRGADFFVQLKSDGTLIKAVMDTEKNRDLVASFCKGYGRAGHSPKSGDIFALVNYNTHKIHFISRKTGIDMAQNSEPSGDYE